MLHRNASKCTLKAQNSLKFFIFTKNAPWTPEIQGLLGAGSDIFQGDPGRFGEVRGGSGRLLGEAKSHQNLLILAPKIWGPFRGPFGDLSGRFGEVRGGCPKPTNPEFHRFCKNQVIFHAPVSFFGKT